MCGLVGLVGSVPDDVYRAAVRGATRRGPHSSGWALWTGGSWAIERHGGPLQANALAPAVIGHSRLATSTQAPGDAPPLDEAQPYEVGGWCLAHNGTIAHPDRLWPDPVPVDSWALLHWIAGREACDLTQVREAAAGRPQAAIFGTPGGRLQLVRLRGDRAPAHPLFARAGGGWTAVSSGPLPGGGLVPEGVTML